jgi:hypothetical protein
MNPNDKPTEVQLDHLLEDLITDLRAEHRAIQPPASLEASILQQARIAAPRHTSSIRVWALSFAGAAALIVAIIALYPRPSHPAIQTTGIATPMPQPKSIQMPVPVSTSETHTPRTRPQQKKRRSIPPNRSTPGLFVPLPNGVGLPEPTQAMLIRTRIQTSSLQSYGLTPPPLGAPTTVLADILVGEDGLPRAIRLVP